MRSDHNKPLLDPESTPSTSLVVAHPQTVINMSQADYEEITIQAERSPEPETLSYSKTVIIISLGMTVISAIYNTSTIFDGLSDMSKKNNSLSSMIMITGNVQKYTVTSVILIASFILNYPAFAKGLQEVITLCRHGFPPNEFKDTQPIHCLPQLIISAQTKRRAIHLATGIFAICAASLDAIGYHFYIRLGLDDMNAEENFSKYFALSTTSLVFLNTLITEAKEFRDSFIGTHAHANVARIPNAYLHWFSLCVGFAVRCMGVPGKTIETYAPTIAITASKSDFSKWSLIGLAVIRSGSDFHFTGKKASEAVYAFFHRLYQGQFRTSEIILFLMTTILCLMVADAQRALTFTLEANTSEDSLPLLPTEHQRNLIASSFGAYLGIVQIYMITPLILYLWDQSVNTYHRCRLYCTPEPTPHEHRPRHKRTKKPNSIRTTMLSQTSDDYGSTDETAQHDISPAQRSNSRRFSFFPLFTSEVNLTPIGSQSGYSTSPSSTSHSSQPS